jgi:FAD:protein FMN transferase
MTTKFIGIILLMFVLTASCKPKIYEYKRIEGFAQGSTFHITYENRTEKDYSDTIKVILEKFNKSLSIYDSTSIVSRINNNEPNIIVDDWFVTVFNKSAEINQLTDGAFDITVGPVVHAWGFGTAPIPKHDTKHIDSLLQFVGMEKVRLENRKVIKKMPGVQLDVNALAQGYSVDVVCDFLKSEGIKNYLVEIGGELMGHGINAKGKPWSIGIDKPIDGNYEAGNDLESIIEIKDKGVATSGNYRKFYIEDGIKYSHTINPKTGQPARNTLLSTTVVASDCMTADALATSFMVMGLDKGKELLTKLKGVDVLFVYSDNNGKLNTFSTEGMKKMIVEMAE